MFRFRTLVLVPLVIVAMSRVAIAAPVLFTAFLNSAQENNSANTSTATGWATFELNDAQTALTWTATIFGIDFTGSQTPGTAADNLTVAHIHQAPAGTNGGVVWGFFGTPFNDTTPQDVITTPFNSGVGGTVSSKWDLPEGQNTTLALQLPAILDNRTYINFHTTQFGGGEIRGQILQTDSVSVPEPATLALLGIGVACFGLRRKSERP
jgi:CHRD domain-containing protein/PEP-CTERM motif-containing protein